MIFLYFLRSISNIILTKAADPTDFRRYDDVHLWDFYGHFHLDSIRKLSKIDDIISYSLRFPMLQTFIRMCRMKGSLLNISVLYYERVILPPPRIPL